MQVPINDRIVSESRSEMPVGNIPEKPVYLECNAALENLYTTLTRPVGHVQGMGSGIRLNSKPRASSTRP